MPQQHTHCALSALSLSDRHNSYVLTCHSRSRSLNIARHTSRTVTYLKSATAPPSATKTRQPLRQQHTFVLSPWQDGRQLTNTTINCLWFHVLHSRAQLLDQLSILQHRQHCSTPGARHIWLTPSTGEASSNCIDQPRHFCRTATHPLWQWSQQAHSNITSQQ